MKEHGQQEHGGSWHARGARWRVESGEGRLLGGELKLQLETRDRTTAPRTGFRTHCSWTGLPQHCSKIVA